MDQDNENKFGTVKTHESYGSITLGRISSGKDTPLYGSSIKHSNMLRIRISHADVRRHLSRDWHHSTGKTIVELDMSDAQFAEFITSTGRGDGTPCTLVRLNGQSIPEPPYDNKYVTHKQEFKEAVDKVGQHLDEIDKFVAGLQEKSSVTKADRAALKEMLRMTRQDIESTFPFLADQFHRQMAQTVHEAKLELAAHEAQQTGIMDKYREHLTALEGPEIEHIPPDTTTEEPSAQ